MPEHARVAGQARQAEAINAEVGQHQGDHAAQRRQGDAGKHARYGAGQQFHTNGVSPRIAQAGQVARLAQQRQLRTVGNGAAHGHEQRRRQGISSSTSTRITISSA